MYILGDNMAQNAAILAILMSLTSLMAIAGSFLTDAYFGKFKMIIISAVIYIIALVTVSYFIGKDAAVSISVTCILIAIGQGCFELLLDEYGEDQINAYYEGKRRAKALHLIWGKTPRFLGSATGSIILIIAEKHGEIFAGWLVTGLMVVAFILFCSGKPSYDFNNDWSPKSPLIRVIRVFVAATLNIHLPLPDDLHEIQEADHEHTFPRTNSKRFLDKAAIPPSPDDAEKSKWRLCRVTEVEETKLLLGTYGIWATLLMCGIVLPAERTLFIEQAYNMERGLGSVLVPVTSLYMLAGLSKLAISGVQCLRPDRITVLGHEITPKLLIGLGMFSSILCCMTAALVERRRLNAYNREDFVLGETEGYDAVNVSIYWIIPQFFLTGATEGLICWGIEGLFKDHLPDCMKSFAFLFLESVFAAGYLLFALLVFIINKATKWLGKDINNSRVDLFYWGLGILSVINLCIYACISWRYSPTQNVEENENNPNIGNSNDIENRRATISAEEEETITEMAVVG